MSVCREPDLNLNIWLVVNQGGFGTETRTSSSPFLVNGAVQRAATDLTIRYGFNFHSSV
jgi:hypothetical protein